jgi:undecaprenyl-diphosphatase
MRDSDQELSQVSGRDGAGDACPWPLDWLTPWRCRGIFLALLLVGSLTHLRFLTHDCPVDLSGDEAQYWDWSRQLDWSYYSKGPLVAWIIRASCCAFGRDTMPAVRFPALLLAAGASALTYLLARRLFGSDRVALGAVLLYGIIPMFAAGSVLMTIDPPFYFCWALATFLAAVAIFENQRWAWPAAGLAAGVGFLAKYAMLLWFVPILLFLAADSDSRRQLRSAGPWVAVGVALLCTTPVLIWNLGHGWASVRHVATQTGADETGKFSTGNLAAFVGGQVAVLGPGIVIQMAGAVVYALRPGTTAGDPGATYARQARYLAWIGLSFLAMVFLTSLRTKVQLNWPAPAYFTVIILTSWFLATRLHIPGQWRLWRWCFYPSVVGGLIVLPVAHDPQLLYPAALWLNARTASARTARVNLPPESEGGVFGWIGRRLPVGGLDGRRIDFSAKLKGWRELGDIVSDERDRLGPGAFVLCADYQETAEMAFYVRGQPRTYYLGSYFRRSPKRLTQYDFWPDRNLGPDAGPNGRNPLLGRNAIFVGQFDKAPPKLREAFERVFDPANDPGVSFASKRAMPVNVLRAGLQVQSFRLIRCYGFRGLRRPGGAPAY